MGISFNDALNNQLLSKKFLSIIPRNCKCGARLEFNDSLKIMYCTNKKCTVQIKNRIRSFCDRLNIDIDDSSIDKMIEKLGLITPYQVLMLPDALKEKLIDENDINNAENIIQSIGNIKQTEYFIYEIAELSGIKSIRNVAYKIFDGFESVEEAYNELELGQLGFINEHLGIKSSDSSIISIEIYNKLADIKEEMLFAEMQFKIKQYSKPILRIAFCDTVSPYINKSELLESMNNTYDYKFILSSTVTDKTDILIKNADTSGNKYRAAKVLNTKHTADEMNNGKIQLDDVDKFIDTELKPIGSTVWITTIQELKSRLNIMRDSDE